MRSAETMKKYPLRKYRFDWKLIGDIHDGRPNLGGAVEVEMYRLLQYTLRDVLEEHLGMDETDEIFFSAGELAGRVFYERYIAPVYSLDEFVSKTQQMLREKKIGVLRIEELGNELEQIVLTMDEDLDCSGLPELDYETCIYDEGFISALFHCFTGRSWRAKEIDCWCTGARTCRFLIQPKGE
jgi:predicted hydrocarbon binding protein